jgi:hypothetical protein
MWENIIKVQSCLLGLSLMMEALRTSETSVDNQFTRQYIPEDNSERHTRRRENLTSHIIKVSVIVGSWVAEWIYLAHLAASSEHGSELSDSMRGGM